MVAVKVVPVVMAAAESAVSRSIELFVCEICSCCIKNILESIRFVSGMFWVHRKEPVREDFAVIRMEPLKEFRVPFVICELS